jgi:hypothetical protein
VIGLPIEGALAVVCRSIELQMGRGTYPNEKILSAALASVKLKSCLRVISWIVAFVPAKVTIHEVTRTVAKRVFYDLFVLRGSFFMSRFARKQAYDMTENRLDDRETLFYRLG